MAGLSCGSECMKYLLFIFNFMLFLTGAALVGLGLWFKLDPNVNDYLRVIQIDQSNPHMSAAIYALIGVGGVVIILGFLGCCGACRHSTCMLCWYAVLIVFVILVEIAAIVLIILYRDELGEELEFHMIQSVQNPDIMDDKYGGEMSPLTASWHAMQVKLKCCGAENYKDYTGNSNFGVLGLNPVPKTCCVLKEDGDDPAAPEPVDPVNCLMKAGFPTTLTEDTDELYVKGCYSAVVGWFEMHGYIMVAVACAIIILQLLNMVFACCLRQEIRRPVRY